MSSIRGVDLLGEGASLLLGGDGGGARVASRLVGEGVRARNSFAEESQQCRLL